MCERVEIAPGGAGENFLLHFDGPLDVTWRHVEFFWGHRIAWPMLAAAGQKMDDLKKQHSCHVCALLSQH